MLLFAGALAVGVFEIQSRVEGSWRISIHIAIRLEVRWFFLRAAGLASDEREHVKNRGNAANVSRNAHQSIFHARMLVGQGFNMFAHIPQPVDFQQKVLESRSHDRSIGR